MTKLAQLHRLLSKLTMKGEPTRSRSTGARRSGSDKDAVQQYAALPTSPPPPCYLFSCVLPRTVLAVVSIVGREVRLMKAKARGRVVLPGVHSSSSDGRCARPTTIVYRLTSSIAMNALTPLPLEDIACVLCVYAGVTAACPTWVPPASAVRTPPAFPPPTATDAEAFAVSAAPTSPCPPPGRAPWRIWKR